MYYTGWDGVVIWFPLCYNNKTCRKITQWKSWKMALAESGRLLSPLPKYERTLLCILIFPLATKPTTRENANNSYLTFFHILLVRNILRQRGRFICERFAFAFYYLLDDVVNSKVLLFANNYHLRCVVIWISFAFEYLLHLNIIIICELFAFGNHSHLIFIRI